MENRPSSACSIRGGRRYIPKRRSHLFARCVWSEIDLEAIETNKRTQHDMKIEKLQEKSYYILF